MKFYLYLFLTILGSACLLGCGGMTFMAVRYLEWGRVLLYGILTLFSAELFGFSFYKAVVLRKKKENP